MSRSTQFRGDIKPPVPLVSCLFVSCLLTKMPLDIRKLSVQLGERNVLNEVSLSVAAGELCCVVGPNGSGKSTLLRAIVGLVKTQSGAITWNGEPLPDERAARARLVAMLPQNTGSGGDLTVEAMAMLGRTPHLPPYGAPSRADREAVEAAVELCAPDLRGRLLNELSGGERQRALLCRALATRAPILLLDEPISALDVRYQHEILALTKRLTREQQLATICVLHGINLAALVADSMVLLSENGVVVARGAALDVMTEANLAQVYGVPLKVSAHPRSGRPQAQTWWDFED